MRPMTGPLHEFIGIDPGIFTDLLYNFRMQDFPGMIRYGYPDSGIVLENFVTSALSDTGESLFLQHCDDPVGRNSREFFTHTEMSTVVRLMSCAWGIFSPDSIRSSRWRWIASLILARTSS